VDPSAALYLPHGQVRHWNEADAPTRVELVPAGHSVHAAMAAALAKVPAAHGGHAAWPEPENVFGWHAEHAVMPVLGWLWPAAQLAQAALPVAAL
jgi:hypothetical protein